MQAKALLKLFKPNCRMFIKPFNQISKQDANTAGGKGASLGEMTRAGLPVPPGFVILTQATTKFLKETGLDTKIGLILKKIDPKKIESIEKASGQIRGMIQNFPIPKDLQEIITQEYKKLGSKYVAVRSSATAEDSKTASWAGELETYLNVTDKNLFASIIKCWSSLFTPRAIYYRFEKKLQEQKVAVAVVVQKMIQSEISGICFTVHPVTKDKNQMVIEAGFGLGETIVGGQVTPDTYVILKNNLSVAEKNISQQRMALIRNIKGNKEITLPAAQGGKQKLSDKLIVQLAEICKKVEQHYKHPQDIEWAFEKNKFYITQSRPITTL